MTSTYHRESSVLEMEHNTWKQTTASIQLIMKSLM
jgi:hypothetical protein